MPDGTEPVDEDEPIYRRVPAKSGYYKPGPTPRLSPKAYKPLSMDTDGLSLTRARLVTGPAEAGAMGYQGKDYYVLELLASDIQSCGLTIQPNPQPDDKSHAIIPELNINRPDHAEVEGLTIKLQGKPYKVHGPFPGTRPPPSS